jgi:hypothetical protein
MKDRNLTDDTKTYNLYQKYLKYKEMISTGRVNKYELFTYPKAIDVEDIEETLRNLKKKKRISEQLLDKTKKIQQTKDIYEDYYSPEKVNIGSLSDSTFNNITEKGKDEVFDFSIDYNFTKGKFELENNPVIFEIQNGMYEYLSININKLWEWIDEVKLYNEARKFILEHTSSKYSKDKKLNQLIDLKINYLKSKKDVSLINDCIDIIKDENYNSPILYKANSLLKKDIINIKNIDVAKAIVKYSKIK